MRTKIRNSYTPIVGEYCDTLVIDKEKKLQYLFDGDGVWTLISGSIDEDEIIDAAVAESAEYTNALVSDEAATREEVDTGLQEQIDALSAASDVKDVVGTRAELVAYPTSKLGDNDIIKVLKDESHNNAVTYNRWIKNPGRWEFIGAEGPYYTSAETDSLFVSKETKINGYRLESDVELSYEDVGAASQEEVTALSNSKADKSEIPTKMSELENDNYYVKDSNYVHTDVNYTAADKNKLESIEYGAEENVQADWDVVDETSDAFIRNKPTIPSPAKLYDGIGENTDGALTQKASTELIYPEQVETKIKLGSKATDQSYGNNSVAIGTNAKAAAQDNISIGRNASTRSTNSIAIGYNTNDNGMSYAVALGSGAKTGGSGSVANGSVALGAYANATRNGEVNIGTTSSNYGYEKTNTRVLGGLHEGVLDTDAVNKKQLDDGLALKADKTELPVVNNGTLSIKKNGANVATFSANQSGDTTADISVPTKTSDLTNDNEFITKEVDNLTNYSTTEQMDSAISTAVSAETTARETAVKRVADDLSAEVTARTNADTALGNRITSESTARENADNNLQEQIDAISASSDVKDIVGTRAELEAYDTSKLGDNDIVKVIEDSAHDNAMTYNRWHSSTSSWEYIGAEGPFYTRAESDSTFVPQTRTVNGKALSSNITLNASDVGALPSSTVIPTVNNATLTIQKNGTNVQTFTANASSNKTANIIVPTKTSDLTNDSNFVSNSTYASADTAGVVKVGSGLTIADGVLAATGGGEADSVAWGHVTGTLANQTDLKTALDAKADKNSLATVATSGSYNDLVNKPTIPAAQVQSDWNATSGMAEILNKPTLSKVATSGSYNDLSNKPSVDGAAWGKITGTLSNQTDLNNALNDKLSLSKTSTQTMNGALYIGSATSNVGNAYTHQRKVTSPITGANVNGVAFAVAATGEASFQHKTYNDSGGGAKNDAVLRFWKDHIQFASNTGSSATPTEDMYKELATQEYVDNRIPAVGNGTITVKQGGETKGTFTVNQSGDTTIDIDTGGSDYTAGAHIDITNNVIKAKDYVHSESPVSATATTQVVSNSMIVDGTITRSKTAPGEFLTLTMSNTDIGEGAPLAANTLYGVYE